MEKTGSGSGGQPFGDYRLLEKIAEGGMAELFLAKRTGVEGFEKVVAIKRILPELSWNPDFVSMFINEAKIAARLSHPNIVQIFDFGKIDDFYFIAMEYVPGQNLRSIQTRAAERKLPMPVDLACDIIARSCAGLDNAHRKVDEQGNPLRIVHRDVSPQNVLVSYEGEVKVVDFGIAKAVAENSRATQGVLKGKFAYLSPEQVSGKKLDARSDVFAIGLVFYELLVGKKLFTQTNPAEILDAILHVNPDEVAKSVPGLTRGVRDILRRSLAADPNARFESAGAMQRALEEHLHSASDVGGTLQIANYMRLLFDDRMGDQTAEALRVSVMGKKRRGLGAIVGDLSPRWIAAIGGAVAGLVTLAIVPNPSAKTGGSVAVEEPDPGRQASLPKDEEKGSAPAEAPAEVPETKPEPPPRDPGELAIERALASVDGGDDAKAIEEFQTAFAQAPRLREPNRKIYTATLSREAKRLAAADSPEAKRWLRAASDADPSSAELHYLLGKALAKSGDRDAAADEYFRAIRLDPRAMDARFNLAVLYHQQGKYPGAVEQYRELVKLAPEYLSDVYYNLSISLEKMGEKDDALKAVKEGLRAMPGNALLEKRKARLGG